MNNAGIIAAVLGVPVFFAVESRLRKSDSAGRLRWLTVWLLLATPSLLVAVYYAHVIPDSEWFYAMRSWRASEFLVLFLGAAAGAFASFWPRLLIGFPLFGFLLLAAVPYLKPAFSPLETSTLANRWQGAACVQSTGSTCGAACVATLLKRAGVETTEREVARASFTSASGTEAWYLARYVRDMHSPHRLYATFHIGEPFDPHFGLPAMVGVRLLGGTGHFIAVLEKNGDQITVADPMRGEEHCSLAEFRKRYTFTGFQMTVAPE